MSKERIISLLNKAESDYKSYIVFAWLGLLTIWVYGVCVEQDRRAIPIKIIEQSLQLRR